MAVSYVNTSCHYTIVFLQECTDRVYLAKSHQKQCTEVPYLCFMKLIESYVVTE